VLPWLKTSGKNGAWSPIVMSDATSASLESTVKPPVTVVPSENAVSLNVQTTVARAEDIRNKVLVINAPTKRTAARFEHEPMRD
jgi:hypothetical protein